MKNYLILILILVGIPNLLFSQLEFKHTNGPKGAGSGYIFSNDDYIFNKGAHLYYRSSDGVTWEKFEKKLGSITINGSNIVSDHRQDGKNIVDISRDNGSTWSTKEVDFYESITEIAISSTTIFVSNLLENTIWKTIDDGETWQQTSTPAQYKGRLYSSDDKIFILNAHEFYQYDEINKEWTEIQSPINSSSEFILDILVEEENIIIATEAKVYTSNDFGNSWITFDSEDASHSHKLAKTNEAIYLVSNSLYKSTDFGQNWNIILNNQTFNLYFYPSGIGNKLYFKKYIQDLYLLDENSETIIEDSEGIFCSNVNDISVQNDSIIWTANSAGVATYNSQSKEWKEITNLPTPNKIYSNVDSNNKGWTVCVESSKPYFYFSEDFGDSWLTIQAPKLGNGLHAQVQNVEIIDDALYLWNDNIKNSLHISNDLGKTWNFVPIEIDDKCQSIIKFKDKFWQFSYTHVYSSDDFTDAIEMNKTDFRIRGLYSTADALFINSSDSSGRYLYYSTDGIDWKKSSWQLADGTLTEDYKQLFFSLELFQIGSKHYAFVSGEGLHQSLDSGRTWSKIYSNISARSILVNVDKLYIGNTGLFVIDSDDLFTSQIEEFSLQLYFEDRIGNKDSITIGYDNQASIGIDPAFDEFDLLGLPYDSNFEVRASEYDYSQIECISEEGLRLSESKKMIREKGFWGENNATMAVIKCENMPITVSWDANLVGDSTNILRLFNWRPGGWGDASCSEHATIINMKDFSQVTFEDTDHRITSGQDSLYTLFFAHSPFIVGTKETISEQNIAKLYPNPVSSTLTIRAADFVLDLFQKESTITFYNTQGKEVKSKMIAPQIQIDDLNDGLYFYKITLPDHKTQKGKVMILK